MKMIALCEGKGKRVNTSKWFNADYALGVFVRLSLPLRSLRLCVKLPFFFTQRRQVRKENGRREGYEVHTTISNA